MVSGSVAWCAAWFEFGGDGVACVFIGRVVIELEKIGGLAVDAFVVVGFVHHSFLACGGVTPFVGGVDGFAVDVVQQ